MQDIQLLYKISVESKQKSINTKELFVKIFRFLYIFVEFGLLCAAAAATIPLTFWRLEPSQEISFSSLPVEPTFLWSMHVWITRGIFVSCLLSIMADKENSFHYIYTFCLGLATVVALCKAKLTRSRQCVPNRSIYVCTIHTNLTIRKYHK